MKNIIPRIGQRSLFTNIPNLYKFPELKFDFNYLLDNLTLLRQNNNIRKSSNIYI